MRFGFGFRWPGRRGRDLHLNLNSEGIQCRGMGTWAGPGDIGRGEGLDAYMHIIRSGLIMIMIMIQAQARVG